jgi:hypothetical protein
MRVGLAPAEFSCMGRARRATTEWLGVRSEHGGQMATLLLSLFIYGFASRGR